MKEKLNLTKTQNNTLINSNKLTEIDHYIESLNDTHSELKKGFKKKDGNDYDIKDQEKLAQNTETYGTFLGKQITILEENKDDISNENKNEFFDGLLELLKSEDVKSIINNETILNGIKQEITNLKEIY